LALGQVLPLGDMIKELATLADSETRLGAFNITYSVTRKQILSVSHVSNSLMMFG